MTKIHATRRELLKAFGYLGASLSSRPAPSDRLLLFYCVECGLKAVYMDRNNLQTTRQLQQDIGHDLSAWSKKLRLPARYVLEKANFLVRKQEGPYDIQYIHQVWRYGIPVDSEHEARICQWLSLLQEWIEENK